MPTVKEAGYDVELEKFRGLAGPKGLPPEVIRIWNEAAQRILADPEYRERYIAGKSEGELHAARRVRPVHRASRRGDGSAVRGRPA